MSLHLRNHLLGQLREVAALTRGGEVMMQEAMRRAPRPEDEHIAYACERISAVLHRMEYKIAQARTDEVLAGEDTLDDAAVTQPAMSAVRLPPEAEAGFDSGVESAGIEGVEPPGPTSGEE